MELKYAITKNSKIIKEFQSPIELAIEFDNEIVILLGRDYFKGGRNVYCVDLEGNILWQVPEVKLVPQDSSYVKIMKNNKNVILTNWDGTRLTIEPQTGKILDQKSGK